MSERVYPKRKVDYIARMEELLDTYTKVFVVNATHVGSKQFQDIRVALRGSAVVLMGKNTVMRKVISKRGKDDPYANLLPLIVGNIGLVFIKDNMNACKDTIAEFIVPAPAKMGVVANTNVVVPPGPTGCDPSKTSYFQTMEIPTKISRGQIEIVSSVNLIQKGDRVTAGQADLLQTLGIRPFTYGLAITMVFDNGSVFDPEVLSITEDFLFGEFSKYARDVAAVGHTLHKPNTVSITHSMKFAFKTILAVVCAEGHTHKFDEAADVLGYLADPSAFVAANPAGAEEEAPAEAAPAEVVEEETNADDIVMSLGGDDDDEAW
jgi:large subunit ribosomal protein LP0